MNIMEVVDPTRELREARTGRGIWLGAMEMMRSLRVTLASFFQWVPNRRATSRNVDRAPNHTMENNMNPTVDEPLERPYLSHGSGFDGDPEKEYNYFLHRLPGELLPDADKSGEYTLGEGDGTEASYSSSSQTQTPVDPQESGPLSEIFWTDDIAALVDPQTREHRDTAVTLACHLRAPNVLTRSRFPAVNTPLETIILNRRGENALGGFGECVVCQSAARTVVLWPCRCLSTCNDCRSSLAQSRFTLCVCCRQRVEGFSKIFVP
jgi:hypothetical protein